MSAAPHERRTIVAEDRGMHRGEPADSCVIVIFGASGDLARRELIPSLFELYLKQLLPPAFAIVGVSPKDWDTAQFRETVEAIALTQCPGDARDWSGFAEHLSFVRGDAASPPDQDYAAVAREIARVRGTFSIDDNVLFHLAVPPAIFGTIAGRLGAAGLATSGAGWRRLVVEKPFGRDRASSQALDVQLRDVFGEEQIYRVDHFLGKETVQNMLVFRFANPSYEPIWNRNYIDHVQVTVAESIGIGTRASFYEQTGVVRDMVQNHLLQLLCMTAMEPPTHFDAWSLRNETAKVLDAVTIAPDLEEGAARGQYGAGTIQGAPVAAYREEAGVAAGSTTATFAALKLTIDNWRWAGVPFYLRTGKRLPKRTTEIAIQFKRPPLEIFRRASRTPVAPDLLIVNVQPDEGISLRFEAKLPGSRMQIAPVMMNFRYTSTFGGEVPEAYETLLLDAMLGDATLFARHDFVEASWALITPVLEAWAADTTSPIPTYEAGEWGPPEADQRAGATPRRWRTL
jgi:glucose-6-phosphate 1-dehydrogenase